MCECMWFNYNWNVDFILGIFKVFQQVLEILEFSQIPNALLGGIDMMPGNTEWPTVVGMLSGKIRW